MLMSIMMMSGGMRALGEGGSSIFYSSTNITDQIKFYLNC